MSKEVTMRQYVFKVASRLRARHGRADGEGLLEDALADAEFHAIWNRWKKSGCKRSLAPSFFVRGEKWITFSEVQRENMLCRARIDRGVRLVGSRWRARGRLGGRYVHLGMYDSKEQALKKVEQVWAAEHLHMRRPK